MIFKIVIIGAGQLGSRHLQAITKLELETTIDVVDPNEAALNLAYERVLEIGESYKKKEIRYLRSIDELSGKVDICIIATTANVRFRILEQLILKVEVKYLILEKILFQNLADYHEATEILNTRKIKAWVNCPRRMFPIYQEIKSLIKPNEKLIYTVLGGDWGLACNAIHFVDHLSYLNDNDEFEFSNSGILKTIHAKRNGFYELSGTLQATQSNKSEIILHAKEQSLAGLNIQILANNYFWQINESRGELLTSSSHNGWIPELTKFVIPYQSELSNIVCEDLLIKGNCDLTPFQSSVKLHLPMLKKFSEIFVKELKIPVDYYPIT